MINKTEFVSNLATNLNSSTAEAQRIYTAFWQTVEEGLKKTDKIVLTGVGNFVIKAKPAREAFNPITKTKIKVAASKAPAFKFGKSFKEKFNK